MAEIQNPENLAALPAKQTADNGGTFAALLQPSHRITVANAAGANPTKAEYDGLLAALRTLGLLK